MRRILLFSILLCSCAVNRGVKVNLNQVNYFLELPKGYSEEILKGELYSEFRYVYPDGSIFFLTDDEQSGSSTNKAKIQKYGENILVKIAVSDTINLQGSLSDSIYWREKKIHNIVVGYINADMYRKDSFDRLIKKLQK